VGTDPRVCPVLTDYAEIYFFSCRFHAPLFDQQIQPQHREFSRLCFIGINLPSGENIMIDRELDLEITRLIDAPRVAVWKAWTDPELLKQWWCPRPWRTEVRGFDFRAGGAFDTLMHGPDGEQSPNPGMFLEVVPRERIVFTTSMTAGYRPSSPPFLAVTAMYTLTDEGKGTRFSARVLHEDRVTRVRHEEMGFQEGWGICFAQLEEVAKTLV